VDVGVLLLVVGAVLAGSVIVALGAARIGVPSLVAFLAWACCSDQKDLAGSGSATPSWPVR
jgi:NhaP-type Na+/H+ and K+/H+ antiporter